jgi:hypothetical protein
VHAGDERSSRANAYIQAAASGSPKHQTNRRGKTFPIGFFFTEVFSTGGGKRIVFGAAIIFRFAPFGANPSLMLETMQRRIKSTLVHLQNVAGDLANSLGDGPAVHRTERDGLEDQQINSALDEVSRLAQFG